MNIEESFIWMKQKKTLKSKLNSDIELKIKKHEAIGFLKNVWNAQLKYKIWKTKQEIIFSWMNYAVSVDIENTNWKN